MIEILEIRKNGKCLGKCECGVVKEFYIANIKKGRTKSCGCLKKSKIPYEVRRTFNLMRYRCNTKTSPDYVKYGGVGIKVLYNNVDEFYKDVGDKPSALHTIDRINGGTSNYEKGNCRWATKSEHSNNVCTNHKVTYKGITKNLGEWGKEYNIKFTTLRERLKRGWSAEKALTTPVKKVA